MRALISTGSVTRPADTTQYAANDVIAAGTAATIPFTGLSQYQGGSGLIQSAVIVSSAAQATKLDCDLLLFSSDITDLDADNAAFTPTDAQLLTLVGVINFPTASWKAGDATSGAGGNAFCSLANIGINTSTDKLYGVLVARNTYTPVASEVLTVKLVVTHNHITH